MIGKLIEIHKNDAYFSDREHLIGTIWDISEIGEWSKDNTYDKQVNGYLYGDASFAEPNLLVYYSNEESLGRIEVKPNEVYCFYAVKFEILENIENK